MMPVQVFPQGTRLGVVFGLTVALAPLTYRRPGAELNSRSSMRDRAFTSTHSLG